MVRATATAAAAAATAPAAAAATSVARVPALTGMAANMMTMFEESWSRPFIG